jgi:hypothetical protein
LAFPVDPLAVVVELRRRAEQPIVDLIALLLEFREFRRGRGLRVRRIVWMRRGVVCFVLQD